MEVTAIRVCATMQINCHWSIHSWFSWNGRTWAGEIFYESPRMTKTPAKRMQKDERMEGVEREKKGCLHMQQRRE